MTDVPVNPYQSADSPPASPERLILQRTGAVLIALGMIRLVVELFSAPEGQLKFEVLVLAVGLAVFFGNMRVIAVVRWLAWLSIVPMMFGMLVPFISGPAELAIAQLRLAPVESLTQFYLPALLTVALTMWVIVQLGRPALLAARVAQSRPLRDMRIPLALGVVLVGAIMGFQFKMLNSADAEHARRLAAAQRGPGYQYHTNGIFYQVGSGTKVRANVQMWNDKEVTQMQVGWEK